MSAIKKERQVIERRKNRVRGKVRGLNKRGLPRIYFYITNKHLYAQLIDDTSGRTLAGVSTSTPAQKSSGLTANKDSAEKLAEAFYSKLQEKNIPTDQGFVFDRGAKNYHGRVKVFADSLREKGLKL